MSDPAAVKGGLDMRRLFYPKWYLKVVGFWSEYDYPPDDPNNKNNKNNKLVIEGTEGPEDGSEEESQSENAENAGIYDPASSSPFMSLFSIMSYTLVAVIAGKLGVGYGKSQSSQSSSSPVGSGQSVGQSVELGSMSSPYMGRRRSYEPISSYQNSGVPAVKNTRVQMEC